MAVDYDLVIIGDTLEGRMAALKFAQNKARVALVKQSLSRVNFGDRVDCGEELWLQGLGQLFTFQQEAELGQALGMILSQLSVSPPRLDYQALGAWLTSLRERHQEALSLTLLAIAGVDVVSGSGEFRRLPELIFVLPERSLRSRFYLLATGAHYCCPKIAGLSEIPYLTPPQLQQPEVLQTLPQSLTIVGNRPIAVAWAQILQRLGHSVTLLSGDRGLPGIDRTLAWQLQAQLEADGIHLSASPLQQVSQRGDRLQLQLSDRHLETEGLIIAGRSQPNLKGLKSSSVGIQFQPNGRLEVNVHLQTTHPRIYACGRIIHQHSSPQMAEREIKTIVRNLLLLPVFSVSYAAIPSCTPTLPPIAKVGLTEERAKIQFGDRVSVLQRSLMTLPKIQTSSQELGYIKLVLLDGNRILGAHLLGEGAEEMISFFALAIQQKIGWNAIAKLGFPSGTFAEGIQTLKEHKLPRF